MRLFHFVPIFWANTRNCSSTVYLLVLVLENLKLASIFHLKGQNRKGNVWLHQWQHLILGHLKVQLFMLSKASLSVLPLIPGDKASSANVESLLWNKWSFCSLFSPLNAPGRTLIIWLLSRINVCRDGKGRNKSFGKTVREFQFSFKVFNAESPANALSSMTEISFFYKDTYVKDSNGLKESFCNLVSLFLDKINIFKFISPLNEPVVMLVILLSWRLKSVHCVRFRKLLAGTLVRWLYSRQTSFTSGGILEGIEVSLLLLAKYTRAPVVCHTQTRTEKMWSWQVQVCFSCVGWNCEYLGISHSHALSLYLPDKIMHCATQAIVAAQCLCTKRLFTPWDQYNNVVSYKRRLDPRGQSCGTRLSHDPVSGGNQAFWTPQNGNQGHTKRTVFLSEFLKLKMAYTL